MQESWIQLQCPSCRKAWEANPRDLSEPDDEHACPDCGASRATAEFTRTARDLEILRSVHGS